jgi:hypothetical protein
MQHGPAGSPREVSFFGENTMSHMTARFLVLVLVTGLALATSRARGEVLVAYDFENGTTDVSGHGLDGELIGDATVEGGRLFLPGGFDNTMSIPLGQYNPFGGETSWAVEFEFQTVDGSVGPLFSSDGSAEQEPWPDNPDTGNQTGSFNVFLGEGGEVVTDYWWIGALESNEGLYNDDEVHTFRGTYDVELFEYTMIIDDADEVVEVFEFVRDASNDRTLVGDESNGDFGGEFNLDGFFGYFDNVVIESDGDLPPPVAGDQLQAGDADQDFDFDQLDLVQVQVTAKYLTGQAATWGEGDWDGAPGGSQGSPPAGNGLFDQFDIIAALDAGFYLAGPYNAVAGTGQPAVALGDAELRYVPEPSTFLLAVFALLGLLGITRRA